MSENDEQEQLNAFVGSFRRLVNHVMRNAPTRESVFRTRVEAHLGADPLALPIVAQSWRPWDHVNLQMAIEAYLREPDVECELVGVTAQHKRHMQLSFSDLLQNEGPMGGFGIGSVDYE